MTDIDLDALEATARSATPGPWIIDSLESGEHGIFIEEGNPDYDSLGCASSEVAGFMVGKNAKHIAAFEPTAALALIARLREAEELIAKIDAEIDQPVTDSEALVAIELHLAAYKTKTEGSEG